jgi:hypothetical protein
MQALESTSHFSLIVYLDKDAALLPTFLKDVRGFFQKFPINYELVAIVNGAHNPCGTFLHEQRRHSPDKEILTIIESSLCLSRTQAVSLALASPRTEYAVVSTVDMATPLGDLFKLLQHLMTEPKTDIVWGNRYTKKDNAYVSATSSRVKLEKFFHGILGKKIVNDPLCEVFAIKRRAALAIDAELKGIPLRGWYLGPSLAKILTTKNLEILEVPVFDSGASSPSYRRLPVIWNLLKTLGGQ